MTKELLLTSLAFGFFVVCPRMAGMIHVISKNTSSSLLSVVLLGTLISLPLLLLMVYVFSKFGIAGALLFCILTDVVASVAMGGIDYRAGIETAIIAAFIILGVKVAPLISHFIIR